MDLTSQTIPFWLVALSCIYTGIIWLLTRTVEIRMDTRAFAWTFILEGFVYGVAFYFLNDNIELRGFLSRLLVMMICYSQALPLTVSYIRSVTRGRKH